MLASLFRGTSSQRHSQYIESVTDEAHTRNLLFGQSQLVSHFATSPPPSPFGSPALRPSSFDDQSGLEFDERDVRILLAQDAHGGDDRPTVLFDSWSLRDAPNEAQKVTRSPLPTNWRPEAQARNRSSTFSENQSSWTKSIRDAPKDDPFLECMFGVPSSAKTASATKLHVIPAQTRDWKASERGPRRPSDKNDRRRAPLARAHTSGQQLNISALDLRGRDALLVTRLFHVTLDQNVKIASRNSADAKDGQDRPAKLVERRVPAFAIGLVFYLPYPSYRPGSSHSRRDRTSSYGASNASMSSSFGSDMHSPYTFFDIIPPCLSSSTSVVDDNDQRVDFIVESWDIILRCLSRLQGTSRKLLIRELEKELMQQSSSSASKTSKDKQMQRPNQRILAIQDTHSISNSNVLVMVSIETSKRLGYALRVPRVITGLGISAGHWIDEARMLYRTFGSKQQNFFLFNLLTAFLGSNVQWLEGLAPPWYRDKFQANHKKVQDSQPLVSRTIIVSDHKGLARRLVYILASFLPGRTGIGGLCRDWTGTPHSTSISPSNNSLQASLLRRRGKPNTRASNGTQDTGAELLSTSAASYGSQLSALQQSPQKHFVRRESNKYDIGGEEIRTLLQNGAASSAAVAPLAAATPTAHISVRDRYFHDNAIDDASDSIASADLSRMLRRAASGHRRTSSVSSRLSSFVSGIWGNKPSTSDNSPNTSVATRRESPVAQHKRSTSSALPMQRGNPLQMMVDELDDTRTKGQRTSDGAGTQLTSRTPGFNSAIPRLHVDAKDGVIDVDLDLPGFLSAASLSAPVCQAAVGIESSSGSIEDRRGSTQHRHAETSLFSRPSDMEHINVGGYLRRHHEDFVLHAVRPYGDLVEDVKNVMRTESTPDDALRRLEQEASPSTWIPVCRTLMADTRTFSIRRFTLRRQYDVKRSNSKDGNIGLDSSMIILSHEEIAEEKVMDFDATLADAIEKMLHVGHLQVSGSASTTRTHSRTVSVSSASNHRGVDQTPDAAAATANFPGIRRGDLVVGALEAVAQSVNEALIEQHTNQDQPLNLKPKMGASQQENALREGVKRWMIDVEHTSVW